MITLSRLSTYPVKSMRGTQISHSLVEPTGLVWDRHFMLTQLDGTFITARKYPELVLFIPIMTSDGIFIQAPDQQQALIRFSDFSPQEQATEVWGNQFTARIAPAHINQWLSGYFPHAVQLRWIGEQPKRKVKHHPEIPLSFADGYPFLLVNEASFYDLQNRCNAGIRLDQFRANLVVAGAKAWQEDGWSVIRVGDVMFDVAKPCSRCIFTTINSQNARKHPSGEPIRTLATFRQAADESGDIDFGLNLLARNSGIISLGDEVSILKTKPPRLYQQHAQISPKTSSPLPESNAVQIVYAGREFVGNNQQILLEQLEQQGIAIPYSCRMGVCGRCRLGKSAGKVRSINDVITETDSLLSCCSIPEEGPLILE